MIKEKELLEWIPNCFQQGHDVLVGPGDDCAVLDFGLEKLYLLAVDQLTADTHYIQAVTSPAKIAKKLLYRNISDIAAMGGMPAHALLAMTLASGKDKAWFREFFESMAEEAKKWNISVCGGDISSTQTDKDTSSLTITGWVEKQALCLRSGSQNGDVLYATGCFGNSFNTEHHLDFTPRLEEARFIAGDFTNTMIDVSDGLLLDAARIAESSEIGLTLELDKIPARNNAAIEKMLTDGEDYELLFAVHPDRAELLEDKWPFKNTPLTAIGSFSKEITSGIVKDSTGKIMYESGLCLFHKAGFDHFD
jgi:thiamine-monophosphate kinase